MMAVSLSSLLRITPRRLAAGLSAGLLLIATPGLAADAAKRDLIGFSRDGQYFAFEQYGVQDGSGFPYSDIFVIDVTKDEWVRGTPARTLIRRDGTPLDKAREESRNRIAPYLWRMNIGTKGDLAVSDPAEKAEEAAKFMAFTLPDSKDGAGLGTVRLRLTEVALPTKKCDLTSGQTHGFSLVLENEAGEPLKILEEDAEIPPSRGCPLHYGISDVVALRRDGMGPALVVLISMYGLGFEGLDRRYLAIGTSFDKNPNGPSPEEKKVITREDVAPPGNAPKASPEEPAETPTDAPTGTGDTTRPAAGSIPSYLINRGRNSNR